jgi:hypothetical protein
MYASANVLSSFEFDAGGNRARQLKTRTEVNGKVRSEATLYLVSYEREDHTLQASALATSIKEKTAHRHSLGGMAVAREIF